MYQDIHCSIVLVIVNKWKQCKWPFIGYLWNRVWYTLLIKYQAAFKKIQDLQVLTWKDVPHLLSQKSRLYTSVYSLIPFQLLF